MKTIKATDVKSDDLLDLEGDQYGGELDFVDTEYARVDTAFQETDNCIVIHTELGSFGCPPDHELKLWERQ